MARPKIFVPRRDGHIEVRLGDGGRDFVRERFQRLRVAEQDADHDWHATLNLPIDPTRDLDDPMLTLDRQRAVASTAELATLTVDEAFLTPSEAWAWLTSLQLALRATAAVAGLSTDDDVKRASRDELSDVTTLQFLLFELAEALSAT